MTLIKRLRDLVKQFWNADDSSAGWKIEQPRSWREALKKIWTAVWVYPDCSLDLFYC